MGEIKFDDTLDITGVHCPLTFVKTMAALEELEKDSILAVTLDGEEPLQNLPQTLQEIGHSVLEITDNKDDTYTIYVKKCVD